jgi:Multidrug resistance efflux pump
MTLLPSELISNSIDAYISKHPTNSQKIYWVVLVAVVAAIVSLPFIYVDVSVQDVGIVRPAAEKTEIKSPITEFVDSIFINEGSKVNLGDTILTFRTNASNYKINYHQSRLTDLQQHIHDLQYLSKGEKPKVFHSDTRRQEYLYFQKQKDEYETNMKKATKEYERNKSLFEKKVISEEDYDQYVFEYSKAENQLASLDDNQVSKWQTDLNSYINTYSEMSSNLKLEEKEKDLYVVTSPVCGTMEHFRGIYKGSNIQAGTSLAVISPDSTLFIEVYMSPRNIGYIIKGMPVNIQVGSFNYNEWGMLEGEVVDISSDFFTDNGSGGAYYKIKCSMDEDFLTHKNGIRGDLKKGMTVSAHFMIARRSLFDLLYQRMDDWINPSQYIVENNNSVASL